MRNTIRVITLFFLIVIYSVTSFSAGSATVKVESTSCEAGNSIWVPVSVSSNAGVMGFKLIISFPAELNILDITAGNIISGGLFNHNAGMNPGKCEVVWSNTENVTKNGQLFSINFRVPSGAKGKYNIDISYSTEDTFNEDWDDVVLKCYSGIITVTNQNSGTSHKQQDNVTQKVSDYVENESPVGVTGTTRFGSVTTARIISEGSNISEAGGTSYNSSVTETQAENQAIVDEGLSDYESTPSNTGSTTAVPSSESENKDINYNGWLIILVLVFGVTGAVVWVVYKKKKELLSEPNTSE